ncbi:SAM hydrolase/SAM-dependent halogenase family protein [Jiangella mangrovi]|uniref:S-adenosylmethionine hydrolase n=1 Tax=Jiangella mangrovi TaxID=1524084 RepID=A0A7W9LLZ6_9ACTN|nr:SAM-dependent chlorinase/fluorinase [Jiangella mangrovi]MBB5788654.1 S-adenosylmethionine hydrolase [Jiangella mangrovi]
MTPSFIAFLTDYGLADGYVAACHGVIARIAPSARVIDVTHDVPAQDVRHGAVVLADTLPYLPPSVLLGVVDPEVGTERRAVAVVAGEFVLVGPDNGLLLWAADAAGGASRAVELTAAEYRLTTGATTFDGRDVFAPAAAHLAAGLDVGALGPSVDPASLVRLADPWLRVGAESVEAEVHVVDRFGNAALAAGAAELAAAGLDEHARLRVTVGDRSSYVPLASSYAAVPEGEPVLIVDSAGRLALAVNRGSAAADLRLRVGERVTVSS